MLPLIPAVGVGGGLEEALIVVLMYRITKGMGLGLGAINEFFFTGGLVLRSMGSFLLSLTALILLYGLPLSMRTSSELVGTISTWKMKSIFCLWIQHPQWIQILPIS